MENTNLQKTSKLTTLRRIAAMTFVIAVMLSQLSDRRVMVAPLSFDAARFSAGINYPWNHYGRDFGSNAWGHAGVSALTEIGRVEADFQLMEDSGVQITRWFVFGDGRSAIRTSSDGTPSGLDEHVLADFDEAISIARRHKIYVIFVLFDFLLLEPKSVKDGVAMGGRREWIVDERKRKALIETVIIPLMQRYGKEPIVAAWEVMNEPEWAMRIRLRNKTHQVKIAEMQLFVSEIVQAIHSLSDRPVTVGSASPGYLKYWHRVGLDLYQYHFYPQVEGRLFPSAQHSHAALGLDKPLILGEFPTQQPLTQTVDYLDKALANGCAGALGWSLRATDKYSNAQNGLSPLIGWSRKHKSSAPSSPAVAPPAVKSSINLEPPHGYKR